MGSTPRKESTAPNGTAEAKSVLSADTTSREKGATSSSKDHPRAATPVSTSTAGKGSAPSRVATPPPTKTPQRTLLHFFEKPAATTAATTRNESPGTTAEDVNLAKPLVDGGGSGDTPMMASNGIAASDTVAEAGSVINDDATAKDDDPAEVVALPKAMGTEDGVSADAPPGDKMDIE